MDLHEAKKKFIHSWGTLGSQWGINRTMSQIHALLLDYRRTLDEKDFDGYAELFGDDGQFVTDDFVATGRAEIRSMLDNMGIHLL